MPRLFALVLFASIGLLSVASANAVSIDWSTVRNANNVADTVVMELDSTTGYGSVPYDYRIAKYDVTVNQHVQFLNAKDSTGANPIGLYRSDMSNATYGGINFNSSNLPAASTALFRAVETIL